MTYISPLYLRIHVIPEVENCDGFFYVFKLQFFIAFIKLFFTQMENLHERIWKSQNLFMLTGWQQLYILFYCFKKGLD